MNETPLLRALFRELFQTEMSGRTHPRKEAKRLAPSPPADAMSAIADDCEATLPRVVALAEERGYPVSALGLAIGRMLSAMRTASTDLVATRELSYRGTLIGLRHAVDVVTLLRATAARAGDAAVLRFCDDWLARRRPMIDALERALGWFAAHPDAAMHPAEDGFLAQQADRGRRALAALDDGIDRVRRTLSTSTSASRPLRG